MADAPVTLRLAELQLKPAGEHLHGRCPFCQDGSFYVSPARGEYKCFGCGARGPVDNLSLAERLTGVLDG